MTSSRSTATAGRRGYGDPVTDRYGSDVLASDPHRSGAFARRRTSTPLPAEPGLVVEEVETGWVGAVVPSWAVWPQVPRPARPAPC